MPQQTVSLSEISKGDRVGLLQVDGKKPNLALMQISSWLKNKGAIIELYANEFTPVDVVVASKIFTFSPDYAYFPDNIPVIKGGSGVDLKNNLPEEVQSVCPDYNMFPCSVKNRKGEKIGDYALGFTTRGCVRNCPFCVVPEKEGGIREVGDIYSFWRGQSHLMLLDNNLTAMPEKFTKTCLQLIKERVYVDFNQGLDIRLITKEMAELLAKVRRWKQIHFAFDDVRLESHVKRGIKLLKDAGIHPNRLTFYVLIGFNSTMQEDMYRIELLQSLGVNPYTMPFNPKDAYQNALTRWTARVELRKSCTWEEYKRSKRLFF